MVSSQRITIPFSKISTKTREFSFNFRQRHEAFLNTDTRRFKISDERHGTPPWQGLLSFHLHLSVPRQMQLGRFKSLMRCLVYQIFFKLHCCDPWSFIFAVLASFQAVLSTGFFFFAMCKNFRHFLKH